MLYKIIHKDKAFAKKLWMLHKRVCLTGIRVPLGESKTFRETYFPKHFKKL